MVKKESKYKTNKKVSKKPTQETKKHNADHKAAQKLPDSIGHIGDGLGDKKIIQSIDEITGSTCLKVYTDNSHYEVIDKKSQRKKKNRTKKAGLSDEEDKYEGSKEAHEEYPKYKVQTLQDHKNENPEIDQDSEEYAYQQKLINKENTKKKKKSMFLEGNPNHMLDQVDMSDAFENSEKEVHNMGGMDAGKKETLSDSDEQSDKHYGIKNKNRTRKKNTHKKIIKAETSKGLEYFHAKS
ncbi:unnamed protein product [Moneuplotes crassus]|uniref:Uncharacterized protein n=1 Tax=Euplotes crassus TaxID=5936 RepID=A0AAD1XNU8_EUPCR|nr:unnamed protein product [Moneuplotes crassus]